MYLGIDLGTSNSAIVGNNNSELKLFKTAEGADVLPSVIYIDKRGHKFVGSRAYDQTVLSPDNVAHGFKRLMGTKSPITIAAAGIIMTPEEASAEIIRTLLAQAATEGGGREINGTIVTIPAAFNQMQSEATIRAATAAGLDRVGLLQEPIAAAMASTAHSKNKSGQFLVYDLGGGTFDLALVQGGAGAVNILAHEGINMLGGRDFDRAIVDSVVRPWLADRFDLPGNLQAEKKYERLIRLARIRAEQAKIELSSKESAAIFVGDEEARASDESGEDMYIEVAITRDHLEALIGDHIDETLVLCRKILKDNNCSHEDIDRIVLIGGPTKMPCIRTRIPQELGIPIDLQTDPMTAVAFGAAIFAESRDWSQGATTRKTARATATTSGPVDIRYDFTARSSDDRTRIRVRPSPAADRKGYEMQIDGLDGWSSGRKEIAADLTIEVALTSRGDNRFRILVFDPKGAPVPQASTEITVTRTNASAAGIPATQTIAIKVRDGSPGQERNALLPVVTKGTLLPASGTMPLRAAHDVKSGGNERIDFELYQRAADVPEPHLNLFIGSFSINGSDITPGLAIRKHDEIIVHWTMDDNGLLNASIEIPRVEQTFTGRFYADTLGHRNFEGEDGQQLANTELEAAEEELVSAESAFGERTAGELEMLQRKLDAQRENLHQAHDADSRRSVTEEARRVRQAISLLRHAPGNRAKTLGQEVAELKAQFDRFARKEASTESIARFDELVGIARTGTARGNEGGFNDAKRALDEMSQIYARELFQQPGYLISLFRTFANERQLTIDKSLFSQHVREGEQAIAANDIDSLRHVIAEMYDNRFAVGGIDRSIEQLAGLMRA